MIQAIPKVVISNPGKNVKVTGSCGFTAYVSQGSTVTACKLLGVVVLERNFERWELVTGLWVILGM